MIEPDLGRGGTSSIGVGVELNELALSIGAAPPIRSVRVTGASDDSRTVRPGDLYVALPGRRAHGLDFELEAKARGAVAALSDRASTVLPTLVVPNPRRRVGEVCARIHRFAHRDLDLYGVTGTNGKTSTTLLLGAGLAAAGDSVATMTGIGLAGPHGEEKSARTTPEAATVHRTLRRFRDEGATAVALEVSSHAVTEHRVDGLRFAVMGFLNLTPDHLDYHGDMDSYFAAKAELFSAHRSTRAVVNVGDPYGRILAGRLDIPCWTWSTADRDADVRGENVECTDVGTSLTARTPMGDVEIRLPLLGPHQAENALAALTMALAAGRDIAAVAAGLERLDAVPGRLERVDVGQPFLAVVDYMHNTAGQRTLLPFVRSVVSGRVIVVVGATGERDPGKRFPLGRTAAVLADVVIVSDESPLSEDPGTIRAAVEEGARAARSAVVLVEADRRRAVQHAVAIAQPGDAVVVAGRGCDAEQVYGDHIVRFDDREVLRDVLAAHVARS